MLEHARSHPARGRSLRLRISPLQSALIQPLVFGTLLPVRLRLRRISRIQIRLLNRLPKVSRATPNADPG